MFNIALLTKILVFRIQSFNSLTFKWAYYFVISLKKITMFEPIHGKTRRGRKQTNFVDVIMRDTNLDDVPDIRNVMMDRDRWKEFVGNARSGDRPN